MFQKSMFCLENNVWFSDMSMVMIHLLIEANQKEKSTMTNLSNFIILSIAVTVYL